MDTDLPPPLPIFWPSVSALTTLWHPYTQSGNKKHTKVVGMKNGKQNVKVMRVDIWTIGESVVIMIDSAAFEQVFMARRNNSG